MYLDTYSGDGRIHLTPTIPMPPSDLVALSWTSPRHPPRTVLDHNYTPSNTRTGTQVRPHVPCSPGPCTSEQYRYGDRYREKVTNLVKNIPVVVLGLSSPYRYRYCSTAKTVQTVESSSSRFNFRPMKPWLFDCQQQRKQSTSGKFGSQKTLTQTNKQTNKSETQTHM